MTVLNGNSFLFRAFLSPKIGEVTQTTAEGREVRLTAAAARSVIQHNHHAVESPPVDGELLEDPPMLGLRVLTTRAPLSSN
eukprot:6465078-Amphidinium_carterae.1